MHQPYHRKVHWAQNTPRPQLRLVLLCLGLALGSVACAPKLVGPTDAGYFVSVQVLHPVVYLRLSSTTRFPEYPRTTDVVVHVQDAQGTPVNGVPVVFQITPATTPVGSLTSSRVLTSAGDVRAVFRGKTLGVARIVIRVDTLTQQVSILVNRVSSGGGNRA